MAPMVKGPSWNCSVYYTLVFYRSRETSEYCRVVLFTTGMHNYYWSILKIFFIEFNLISQLSGLLDSDLSDVTFHMMIFPNNGRHN